MKKIGFIGAGKMATALGRGIVQAGLAAAADVAAFDPNADSQAQFREAVGAVSFEDSNAQVSEKADVLIVAVKPGMVAHVLGEIANSLGDGTLVISIAAGIRLEAIEKCLGPDARLVRVMPNTPCLVGKGASAYCIGGRATEEDAELVESLLGAVGVVCRVDESLMDAVTGLSGSGPAFVYMIIQSLRDGGIHEGLPVPVATTLAVQTVLGTAEMVLQTGEHPSSLRDKVTSPGGTTIAGIHALEKSGLRGALMGAVIAASERSAELGAKK